MSVIGGFGPFVAHLCDSLRCWKKRERGGREREGRVEILWMNRPCLLSLLIVISDTLTHHTLALNHTSCVYIIHTDSSILTSPLRPKFTEGFFITMVHP